ncbi:non-structural maintenance of chromosomes element 3 homolog [Halictus rubicundus]|uniref:non-structural maintenance of chromosomes element 3 homolog n=1 Tax=Halictus rubicundus TaxID=77578 RepID=UPI0040358413
MELSRNLSQPSTGRKRKRFESLSQPSTSESFHASSPNRMVSEEEAQLANSVIRYLFVLDRDKQVINKSRIIKNVLGGQGKQFHRVINKVKTLLLKIFGYDLVELEGNKYILVNELVNSLPHIQPMGTEGSQKVLLFLVLTHIFMGEESCREESLLDFLTNLGIITDNVQNHSYFGDVKHIVSEVFVAQRYLDKIEDKNETSKIEYKWGPRAEYEFSRRTALEFASEIYNGRPINSWSLQYKTMVSREKSDQVG